jgi:hypothetical protein
MPRYHTLAAIFAAGLLLAACGGSGSGSPGGGSKQAAALAFARCMRTNGVANFPDPTDGNGGIEIQASQRAGSGQTMTVNGVPVSAPAFQSAMRKCQKDLPHGGPGGAHVSLPKLRAAALAMARCMRSHGVPNFPDPQVSSAPGGGVGVRIGGGPGSSINPGSPAFQAAQKLCQPLLRRAIGGGAAVKSGPGPQSGSSGT